MVEDPRTHEQNTGPEDLSRRVIAEQLGSYPIQATDLIIRLQDVEVGPNGEVDEIAKELEAVWAYQEGLIYGERGEIAYATEGPQLIRLHNLFTTMEDSTRREQAIYLDTQAKMLTQDTPRAAQKFATEFNEDPMGWETKLRNKIAKKNRRARLAGGSVMEQEEIDQYVAEEKSRLTAEALAIPGLIGLEVARVAREYVDGAFRQRTEASEDPGTTAELLMKGRRYDLPITPDKGHMQAFFGAYEGAPNKEWGEKVSRTLNEMISMGLPLDGNEAPNYGERLVPEIGPLIPGETRQMVREKFNEYRPVVEMKVREVPVVDERGDPRLDPQGNQVMEKEWYWEQQFEDVTTEVPVVDAEGNPEIGEGGNPVMRTEVVGSNPLYYPVPNSIYARGFETVQQFAEWFDYLVDVADGDASAVWAAWRVGLAWEVFSQLGMAYEHKVVGNATRREVTIANPPVPGGAITPWVMFLDKKQRIEWGLDADGNRVVVDRNPTHTGFPLFFLGPSEYVNTAEAGGAAALQEIFNDKEKIREILRDPDRVHDALVKMVKFRQPCLSYLHETKISIKDPKDNKKRIKVTLLQRLMGDASIGLMPMSMADNNFEWMLTEKTGETVEGELPPGSFGGWRLRLYRAWNVVQNLRSRPGKRDNENEEFFAELERNWGKIFGPVPDVGPGEDGYLEPWQNPRTWWVASIVHNISPTPQKSIAKGEADYRVIRSKSYAEHRATGISSDISVKDILAAAVNKGFLRPVDQEWILKNIGG